MNKKGFTYYFEYFISALLLLFTGLILFMAITDCNDAGFLCRVNSKRSIVLILVCGTIFFILFLRCMYKVCAKLKDTVLFLLSVLGICMGLAVQIYILFSVQNLYLFDNAFVSGGASTLAMGLGVDEHVKYYFSVYPNQNAFIVLTSLLWKIGSKLGLLRGQIPVLLNAVNMAALDICFIFIYKSVKKLYNLRSQRQKFVVILVLLINPIWYIGVCYYYTVTLSLPFMSAFLYLVILYTQTYLRQEQTTLKQEQTTLKQEQTSLRQEQTSISKLQTANKNFFSVFFILIFAIIAAYGYCLRATQIIPIIAFFMMVIGVILKRDFGIKKRKKLLVRLGIFICLTALISQLISGINKKYVGLDTEDTAFPAVHWVMMSMTSPGCHNAEDEAYTASFNGAKEKKRAVKQRLFEKVNKLDTKDFVKLGLSKIDNTWGNGVNAYPLYLEHCRYTDSIYPWMFGQKKDFVILYHNIVYILILFGIIWGVFHSFQRKRDLTYNKYALHFMRLTLVGGILFYLLWETSGQYSVPFMPFMLVLAAKPLALQMNEQVSNGVTNSLGIRKKEKVEAGFLFSIGMIALFIVSALFLKKQGCFVYEKQTFTHPVVSQILANEKQEVTNLSPLKQSFVTDQPFNRIIFQVETNDVQNDGRYSITLEGEKSGIILFEELSMKKENAREGIIRDFETVLPKGRETFYIIIKKTDSDSKAKLYAITYAMGSYDAWPDGELTSGNQNLSQDLLMEVDEISEDFYMSKAAYYSIWIIIILLFIIFEISEFKTFKGMSLRD